MPQVLHSWRRTCQHCKTHLQWPRPHTLPYLPFVSFWGEIELPSLHFFMTTLSGISEISSWRVCLFRLMLHPPPILVGKRNWMRVFTHPLRWDFWDSVYRAGHLLAKLCRVDIGFGSSTVWPVPLRQMVIGHNWLGSWARWLNILIKVNPTQLSEPMSCPLRAGENATHIRDPSWILSRSAWRREKRMAQNNPRHGNYPVGRKHE